VSVPERRHQAEQDLLDLESLTGSPLRDLPVHLTDQWGAGVRDVFRELDAPLTDEASARAAFAGAYLTVALLSGNSYVSSECLTSVGHVLRWLFERGERRA